MSTQYESSQQEGAKTKEEAGGPDGHQTRTFSKGAFEMAMTDEIACNQVPVINELKAAIEALRVDVQELQEIVLRQIWIEART